MAKPREHKASVFHCRITATTALDIIKAKELIRRKTRLEHITDGEMLTHCVQTINELYGK